MSVAGHAAHIRPHRVAHDAELEEPSNARIPGRARQGRRQGEIRDHLLAVQLPARFLFVIKMIRQVHHVELLADGVGREVDDDVVAFGDPELIQLRQQHRLRQQVAVVGDLDHRLRHARRVGERDLVEPGHAPVQDPEAIFPALHFEIRIGGEVHRHDVAHEAVEFEDVEEELTVLIERLVANHQVHVVIEIAPGVRRPARQPQVDTVVDLLVAAIQAAVDVEHRGVALVDVLRGEAEHVVVEPMRAHRLVPVPRHVHESARVRGGARHRIGRAGIHGGVPREHDRPVVVVVLVREEERPGEPVILRPVVPVVLVRGEGVAAETAVLPHVGRQAVVVAEEDWLAIARHHQLRRHRAVERPHAVGVLRRPLLVEPRGQPVGGIDAGIQARRDLRVVQVVRRPRRLVAEMATAGACSVNFWCAQTGPGGRPSIGPKPPPSIGSTALQRRVRLPPLARGRGTTRDCGRAHRRGASAG